MIVARRGMGDWMTDIIGVVGKLFGGGTKALTVPTECMSFDMAGQMQCAQMWAQVKSGQVPQMAYMQWVQEQGTMQTIKKYAPYALLGIGAIVVVSMLRRKD